MDETLILVMLIKNNLLVVLPEFIFLVVLKHIRVVVLALVAASDLGLERIDLVLLLWAE